MKETTSQVKKKKKLESTKNQSIQGKTLLAKYQKNKLQSNKALKNLIYNIQIHKENKDV